MRPDAEGLIINPSIPSKWDGFKMTKKFRGKLLNIVVKNPDNVQSGVKSMTMNGKAVSGNKIFAADMADVNEIEVVLG